MQKSFNKKWNDYFKKLNYKNVKSNINDFNLEFNI